MRANARPDAMVQMSVGRLRHRWNTKMAAISKRNDFAVKIVPDCKHYAQNIVAILVHQASVSSAPAESQGTVMTQGWFMMTWGSVYSAAISARAMRGF
jgi:hypothetical protein